MSLMDRVRQAGNEENLQRNRNTLLKREIKKSLDEKIGYRTLSRIVSMADTENARLELTPMLTSVVNGQKFKEFSRAERNTAAHEILDEMIGLGPLESLMKNPEVTEIMVNGVGSLFYEINGVLHHAPAVFQTVDQIGVIIDRILAPIGRRVDEMSPVVNARLADGSRLNVVIPPIALDGPVLTIRKFSKRITDLQVLVELQTLPSWYAWLLTKAVSLRQNIAVAGGTGSGKTTLLNSLSTCIAKNERIVTIEDSAELQFSEHPHVIRLEAREASIEGVGRVSIRDLVVNSLRMRPDRIVVGEVRGEEAIDMLQAMNTGHDGSLTTLHAGSPREAIDRLILMARFGMDLPASVISQQVSTALDLIVMTKRNTDGSRSIGDLSQIKPGSGAVELEEVVSQRGNGNLTLVREPDFLLLAQENGILKKEELANWRKMCP